MGGSTSTKLNQELSSSSLNQSISNIMTNNESNISNVITMDNTIDFENHGTITCPKFEMIQENKGDLKAVTEINNSVAADLKADLSASVQASGEQSNKLVQGFLSGIGQENNTEMNNKITTAIQNVINNNVTTNNINRTLNQVNAKNKNKFVNTGTITGEACKWGQTNVAALQANTILQNLMNTVIANKMVSDTVAKATQSNVTEQKGLDDLMGVLTWPIVICIVAVVVSTGYFGGKMAESGSLWKIILVIAIVFVLVVGAYLVYYFFFKEEKEVTRWVPKKDSNGYNIGGCEEKTLAVLDDSVRGGLTYGSEQECDDAGAPTYWRCPVDEKGMFVPGTPVQCVDEFDKSNPNAKRLGIVCEWGSPSAVLASGECKYAYSCYRGQCSRVNSKAIDKAREKFGMGDTDEEALAACTNVCTA
jgi:hypothetical protein